jgi:hypothetical protein
MYLFVLGAVNLSRRPLVTSGARDTMALALAISGFVAAGPMELFLPEAVAVYWGGWVWGLMLACYGLMVALLVLTMRPRIIVYNCTRENLRPVLTEVVTRLDPAALWAGDTVHLFQLGVEFHLDHQPLLKTVQLAAAGADQDFGNWRRLEAELGAALRTTPVDPNPLASVFLSVGLVIVTFLTYWMARDPAAVQHALNEMLRR